MATSNRQTLFPLCVAFAKQKKYNKAFLCFDQVEIDGKGDINMADVTKMERNSPFMMGLAKFGPPYRASLEQDATQMLYIMRAEAYMDIGDFRYRRCPARLLPSPPNGIC